MQLSIAKGMRDIVTVEAHKLPNVTLLHVFFKKRCFDDLWNL